MPRVGCAHDPTRRPRPPRPRPGALAAAPASAHHGPRRRPRSRRCWRAPSCPPTRRRPPPSPASPNTEPAPAPGSVQPVGGFSALLDAPGFANYWAMPDNGFGTKANSHSFLLRVYKVHADFETAHGGAGTVQILKWITLRDPDHKIPFELVNDATPDRLLTGGDFDIESFREDSPRHAVVRRGVRPLPAAHRRDRQGARGADPAARRQVARLPARLPRARRRAGQPRELQRLRGHGDLARRPHALPDARGPGGRRRPADAAHVPVRHPQPPLRRQAPHLPHGRPGLSCSPTSRRSTTTAWSRSSATTRWAPRPSTSRPS